MAFFIEFAHDPAGPFYQQIEFADHFTGEKLEATDGVNHQLSFLAGGDDYGCQFDSWQVIASEANGLITRVDQGVIAINIPSSSLAQFRFCETVKFKLRAVPADPAKATVLANGTISFGAY